MQKSLYSVQWQPGVGTSGRMLTSVFTHPYSQRKCLGKNRLYLPLCRMLTATFYDQIHKLMSFNHLEISPHFPGEDGLCFWEHSSLVENSCYASHQSY